MNEEEFNSENLSPETKGSLHQLAQKLGCSDEEVASKIVHLVLNQIEQPDTSELNNFVLVAKQALKE